MPPEQLYVHSASFDHHNKDNPKNKHDPVLDIVTGRPQTIDQYVDCTMISQAEGLKFGVEHYRRRAPHCSGTLVWQFNDVWPGFSWSVVDYDLVPKAAYHYLSRAYAPLLASFRRADDTLELWLSTGPGRASLTVTATGFAYFVHALTPSPGARFHVNYLDLRGGEAATIEVTGLPDGFDPAAIEVRARQPRC